MVKSRTRVGAHIRLWALTSGANHRLAAAATHVGVQTAQTPTQAALQHQHSSKNSMWRASIPKMRWI
jgi:hypothetical protein